MSPIFFIKRPIFALSIAILMVLVGGICVFLLPIAQFPEITPPQVQVTAGYPGASSEVVADIITTPIEEQVNGVENMMYMSSNSTNNGASSLTISFNIGTDLDIAAVDVQNRVDQAMANLPSIVQKSGVSVTKQSTTMLAVVSLYSEKDTYDSVFMGNYADIHLYDELKRVPGVGSITIFGLKEYAMRVWLDPQKMTAMGITPETVASAISKQNLQIVAGQVGALPLQDPTASTFQLTAKGRLENVDEFADIIVRSDGGAVVRIRDIGSVELGAQTYASNSTLSGKPATSMGIYQLPGANALDVTAGVKEAMARLAENFPDDLAYQMTFDTSEFVRISLVELVVTLLEAVGLVVLVIFIFLQSWRAAIIPVIAIPVSLIGAFAIMMAFGFSINTLTLLGLVLAIGLVVDDAIVVVENVERQMEKGNVSRRKATAIAMKEVTGPIIATSLVLLAVFIPASFVPGISGQLYNQFSLTIAFSVVLSTINSLSLSPALCGVLLRVKKNEERFVFFRWFNTMFEKVSDWYASLVQSLSKAWVIVLLVFCGLTVLMGYVTLHMSTGFVPEEDQGYFFVSFEGPPSMSLSRTDDAAKELTEIMMAQPGIQDVVVITGVDFLSGFTAKTSSGMAIPILTNWEDRTTDELSVWGIMASLRSKFHAVQKVQSTVLNAPAIMGLGSTGGFAFQIRDLNAQGAQALGKVTDDFIERIDGLDEIAFAMSSFSSDAPMYHLDIDRTKAKMLNIDLSTLFDVLQYNLASVYINDFNKYGKVYQVIVQAEGSSRRTPQDIGNLEVMNTFGEAVPLSALVEVQAVLGSENLSHYNMYTSAQVIGSSSPGFSSGDSIKAIRAEVAHLPQGYDFLWTDVVYQQIAAIKAIPIIFGLAILVVFLFLSAQYESWTIPFMILLTAPLAILGAVLALKVRSLDLDIYGQIGLILLIGLASKNAILIVEFAKKNRESGMGIVESAMNAAKLRLRPILMTALAFILGVVPLVIATGAGENSRHSIGTTVFGGMIAATFLSLVFVPIFYIMIESMREKFGFTSVIDDEDLG
ncbi:MAG: hydrophobe/amphiphile efflux-1 family RND transporter [Phycisphaerae bacterium]|nr:hydrophobe/amphiphile efflux-1 family RND transporter [Phycisphaerae bacterium]